MTNILFYRLKFFIYREDTKTQRFENDKNIFSVLATLR